MTPVMSVSQANDYLKKIIEGDPVLNDLWIEGEIIQSRPYKMGGQIYVTLSDGHSQINGVIYSTFLGNIKTELKVGVKVQARGQLKWYQKRGSLTFQIVYMSPAGTGNINAQFEALKQKLTAEGLFSSASKKQIPSYPTTVGIITAEGSAAFTDFVSIFHELAPSVQLYFVPAIMQGQQSSASIIRAIEMANEHPIDVLVVLRGGGSAEDLASFNDEALVRAIGNCPMPITTAIGHEVDVTLSDFSADFRFATPTDAAQQLGLPFSSARQHIAQLLDRASATIHKTVAHMTQSINQKMETCGLHLNHRVDREEDAIHQLITRASLANPIQLLKRGYSIPYNDSQNQPIKSVQDISKNDTLKLTLSDGEITAICQSPN